MAQSLLQPRRLDREDLFASGRTHPIVGGDEGVGIDVTAQIHRLRQFLEHNPPKRVRFFVDEAPFTQTQMAQALQIDVGEDDPRLVDKAFVSRQYHTVFGDHRIAAENHVGGRFPHAAGGIGVRRHAAGTLA